METERQRNPVTMSITAQKRKDNCISALGMFAACMHCPEFDELRSDLYAMKERLLSLEKDGLI